MFLKDKIIHFLSLSLEHYLKKIKLYTVFLLDLNVYKHDCTFTLLLFIEII